MRLYEIAEHAGQKLNCLQKQKLKEEKNYKYNLTFKRILWKFIFPIP